MDNYKLLPQSEFNGLQNVKRLSDNVFIPFDPANSDYQDYLKWVDEGGIPEPADE